MRQTFYVFVLAVVVLGLVVAARSAPLLLTSTPHSEQGSSAPMPNETTAPRFRVFTTTGTLTDPIAMPRLVLTDAQWRGRLTPEQFRILRNAGTEAPFCGTLLDNKKPGIYSCAGCSLPLFSSDHKFNSGTGWPSFYQPVAAENIVERADRSHGMDRVEILCARCDGHLGHVFDDGPRPTGQRHCLNSESLVFTDSDQLASRAEVDELVLAGGCFWCVEAVFEELKGVYEVISGYAGGSSKPSYQQVTTGTTGHAESVKIIFDPAVISSTDLLRVHFATHDPTTLNRQGADVGTHYRSAIFYRTEQEKAVAEAMIADLTEQKVFRAPIVTTLEPLTGFHPAEAYHQNYVCTNPTDSYVRNVALPKVEKVRKKFADQLKDAPRP
jgi:peptide methionine sulfoxide reductase msrA/msrB